MENQTQTRFFEKLKRFLFNNKIVNTDIERLLTSLSIFSMLCAVITLFYLGGFLYKLLLVPLQGASELQLPITGENLLQAYSANDISFYFIAAYEILKLALVGSMAFYFWKFAVSIDNKNPFRNPLSRNYIGAVATLALLFFPLEIVSTLHLNYNGSLNVPQTSTIGLFHWEYLLGAYFVNVFAIVYRRGADLNNEMNLVI